jgi:glucan phosphoethanolaminetransferase (alkaline phosphatase superfamily)
VVRYGAFFFGVLSGVFILAGAIMGLGIGGIGFVFGPAAPLPTSMGVGFAIMCAIASIFVAVLIMFVRDVRPIGLFLVVVSVGAAIAGGPWAVPGAVSGLLAAFLTFRVDPVQPLV